MTTYHINISHTSQLNFSNPIFFRLRKVPLISLKKVNELENYTVRLSFHRLPSKNNCAGALAFAYYTTYMLGSLAPFIKARKGKREPTVPIVSQYVPPF